MIDRIYRTVLSILNKEQRGYITPEEFNQFAQQAQVEIYEGYFYELGRAVGTYGQMMDDFTNIPDHVMEKLQPFRAESTLNVELGVATLPNDLYRLGEVFRGTVIVDMADHKMIRYIVNSPLTAPTTTQPVYTRTGNILNIYPPTIGVVDIEYIKELATIPTWAGTTINGQLVNNPTDTVEFELVDTEEPELMAKILSYAGVSVRANDVAQAAVGKDQQLTQSEQ